MKVGVLEKSRDALLEGVHGTTIGLRSGGVDAGMVLIGSHDHLLRETPEQNNSVINRVIVRDRIFHYDFAPRTFPQGGTSAIR